MIKKQSGAEIKRRWSFSFEGITYERRRFTDSPIQRYSGQGLGVTALMMDVPVLIQ